MRGHAGTDSPTRFFYVATYPAITASRTSRSPRADRGSAPRTLRRNHGAGRRAVAHEVAGDSAGPESSESARATAADDEQRCVHALGKLDELRPRLAFDFERRGRVPSVGNPLLDG